MRRGCLDNLLFITVLLLAFGGSSYFWFTFFVKGRSLPTPDLIGKTPTDARKICSDIGVNLKVDEGMRHSDRVPAGRIVWQNRTAGTTRFLKRGATIRVELSAGPLVLRVPQLEGQSLGTGMLRLGQQNLKPAQVSYVDNIDPRAKGILATDPPKDTVVAAQKEVSLLVAVPTPPKTYVMPDLIDRALDEVRPTLEIRGLKVATVKYEAYPGIRDGIIIRQYPLRGAPVSSRDPISVVVSRQEEVVGPDAPAPASQPES